MDFLQTTSQSDLGVFALGLVIAGAVGGLAAGVLGIGAGIVIVPVLYHVMAALGIAAGVRMHVAIATSLAAMIPAALTQAQNAKPEIQWDDVRIEALPLLLGVAIGSAGAAMANGSVLAVIFAIVAFAVVVYFAGGKPNIAAGNPRGAILLPSITGITSALTGIGADTVRRCIQGFWKADVERTRATVSVLAVFAPAGGALAYGIAGWNAPDLPPDSLGYVNLIGFALIAPVMVAAEPAGAALGHMMDLRRLRLVFAALVVVATARMLWDAFT